jgi:hypothetical protein
LNLQNAFVRRLGSFRRFRRACIETTGPLRRRRHQLHLGHAAIVRRPNGPERLQVALAEQATTCQSDANLIMGFFLNLG